MPSHRPDLLAAVAGLVFVLVALAGLLGADQLLTTPGLLPAALVLIGGAGLVSAWLTRRSHDQDDDR